METKPGIQTTEFWFALGVNLATMIDMTGVASYLPDKYAALAFTVVNAAYALSRGLAKLTQPFTATTARR